MKKTLFIFLVFTVLAVQAQTVMVDFNNVIVKDFAGFGTQYNENVYSVFSKIDGITAGNIGQLEAKVKNLKSQYVRIFFDSKSWVSDPKYSIVPSDFMESFIKTVKLAQDAGASTINITYWSGPTPEKMPAFAELMYDLIINRNLTAERVVKLIFDNASNGLTSYSEELSCFEVAGANKRFYPVIAFITGTGVTLISSLVPEPVSVRYAFKDYIVGDLFITEGLPVSSFRTDEWKPEKYKPV